ncbi:hypothetical protein D3C84_1082890 [compost metagenome]
MDGHPIFRGRSSRSDDDVQGRHDVDEINLSDQGIVIPYYPSERSVLYDRLERTHYDFEGSEDMDETKDEHDGDDSLHCLERQEARRCR